MSVQSVPLLKFYNDVLENVIERETAGVQTNTTGIQDAAMQTIVKTNTTTTTAMQTNGGGSNNGKAKINANVPENANASRNIVIFLRKLVNRIEDEMNSATNSGRKQSLGSLKSEIQSRLNAKDKISADEITAYTGRLQELSNRAQIILVWNRYKGNNASNFKNSRQKGFSGIQHIIVPEAAKNAFNKIGNHIEPLEQKIKHLEELQNQNPKKSRVNVIMSGPSGSGKTEIFKKLSGIKPETMVTAIYPVISIKNNQIMISDKKEELKYSEFLRKYIEPTPLNLQSSRAHMYFENEKGSRFFDLAGSESSKKLDDLFAKMCTGKRMTGGRVNVREPDPMPILTNDLITGSLQYNNNNNNNKKYSSAEFAKKIYNILNTKLGTATQQKRSPLWNRQNKSKCTDVWSGEEGFKKRTARLIESLYISPSNDQLREIFASDSSAKSKIIRIKNKNKPKDKEFKYMYTSNHIRDMIGEVGSSNLVIGTVLSHPPEEKKQFHDTFTQYMKDFHLGASKNRQNTPVNQQNTQVRKEYIKSILEDQAGQNQIRFAKIKNMQKLQKELQKKVGQLKSSGFQGQFKTFENWKKNKNVAVK